jgi:hypothetical protein
MTTHHSILKHTTYTLISAAQKSKLPLFQPSVIKSFACFTVTVMAQIAVFRVVISRTLSGG